jgi:hypothetical protein
MRLKAEFLNSARIKKNGVILPDFHPRNRSFPPKKHHTGTQK